MSVIAGPSIVSDGLVFYLDSANPSCYAGTGSTLTDLAMNTTATLVNAATFTSVNNGCIDVDGANGYIQFTKPITSTAPYTILQWLKADVSLANSTSSEVRQTPFVGSAPVWNPGYWMTGLVFRVHANNQYRDHTISLVGDTGWHMFGQNYNGSTLTYGILDGQILSGGTVTSYAPSTTTVMLMGKEVANASASATSWNGKIGVTMIYNRLLTAEEVMTNYNAMKGRYV